MANPHMAAFARAVDTAGDWLARAPVLLAVLPALSVATFVLGGMPAFAVGATLCGAGALVGWWRAGADGPIVTPTAGTVREEIAAGLDHALAQPRGGGHACIVIRLDDMTELATRLEPRVCAEIADRLRARAAAVLRDGDRVDLLDAEHLVATIARTAAIDLETMMQIAGRVQIALHAPLDIEVADLRASATLGFAIPQPGEDWTGARLVAAAEDAMVDARLVGPGTIRAHTAAVSARRAERHALQSDARRALAEGAIVAWFQPQICTGTGRVSGVEALARWHDPDRGWISPAAFLPALAAAGEMTRLADVMLAQSLDALRAWDRAGASVPRVSINLSEADLADPGLTRRIAWELDRADIAPHRLGVEVLESVISTRANARAGETLAALADMGCTVDLDDFGTGCASITAIKAFPISRIKIDRQFVDGLESHPAKQKMIAAILTMAERLEVDTLAEGVETDAQHALLAQYGCGHLQGFGIARPMPRDAATTWLAAPRTPTSLPASLRRNSR